MKLRHRKEYVPARSHASLTTGEVVRMLRELKGWTQDELSERSSLGTRTISLLENERIMMSKQHAEQLAKAFGIHPAIIMFPEYEVKEIKRAA